MIQSQELSNIRMSDQTIDRRYGVWGNNFDQNSPPAVPTNQFAIMGWDDTRFSTGLILLAVGMIGHKSAGQEATSTKGKAEAGVR